MKKIAMRDVVAKRSNLVTVSFECSETAARDELVPLLEYIGKNGNGGHSFGITVDPELTDLRRGTF